MVHNPVVGNVYWVDEMTWSAQGIHHTFRRYRCKKYMPGGMVAMHRLDDEDSSSIVLVPISRLAELIFTPVRSVGGDI